jgi:hypothetical protein
MPKLDGGAERQQFVHRACSKSWCLCSPKIACCSGATRIYSSTVRTQGGAPLIVVPHPLRRINQITCSATENRTANRATNWEHDGTELRHHCSYKVVLAGCTRKKGSHGTPSSFESRTDNKASSGASTHCREFPMGSCHFRYQIRKNP